MELCEQYPSQLLTPSRPTLALSKASVPSCAPGSHKSVAGLHTTLAATAAGLCVTADSGTKSLTGAMPCQFFLGQNGLKAQLGPCLHPAVVCKIWDVGREVEWGQQESPHGNGDKHIPRPSMNPLHFCLPDIPTSHQLLIAPVKLCISFLKSHLSSEPDVLFFCQLHLGQLHSSRADQVGDISSSY